MSPHDSMLQTTQSFKRRRRQIVLLTAAGLLGGANISMSKEKDNKMGRFEEGFFDKDYFFLLGTISDRIPDLTPDRDTARKNYRKEVMPFGSKPLIFDNVTWKMAVEDGKIITPMDPPPDVLFDADDLVVCERIARKLNDMKIPHLAIQPAIFIDHKDEWHEYYWFLTFTKSFDCWDRERSRYNPKPFELSGTTYYSVDTYSLNDNLLRETPLRERLLFEMGGAERWMKVAHKSIVDLFRVEGVDIVPITDYGVNYPKL